ncbi:MAG: AarF/UbiB family protein [Bryobacteraceae bacterium]
MSLLIAAAWGSLAAQRPFSVQIPVPKQHHDTYDADAAALEVMQKVMAKLDPQTQELVMGLMASGATPGALPPIEPDQMVAMIDQFGLRAHKQELIELFIHKSQILDLVPPEHRPLILPIFHDSLLAFIDGLSDDRLADRVSAMMKLGPNATRGEKILVLLSKIPTLQKLGQIVARIEGIPPDVSQALQSLESGIHTMTAEELTGVIGGLLGEEKIQRYQVRFADKVLAEASVGAVIRATIVEPGSSARQEVVAKLIKPYVLAGVPREMAIIDGLLEVVQEHGEFYQVGGMPLKDLFADLKAKLADELRVAKEQEHLVRAAEYYRGHRLVKVPKFFSGLSNQSVTFMEFLRGEKITDSFKGDAKRRAELARRLLRVMKFETLFSEPSTALFHGDPHAGNVMHITNDASEPYKIGLLDWGLMGEFERPQRLQMVQLSMALDHKSRKKIRSNVGGLLKDGLPRDAVRRADVFRLADEALQAKGTTAEVYAKLVEQLARHGFLLDGDFALFIKSQLTLDGIYRELDPTLDPDEYLKKMASRQVRRELPKRLLLFPALGYRGYRSMLSNGEVFFGAFH